ncbi:MAG: cell wall metabolism sensor histidine kinase WalK [Chlorobium sp.]|nr:MAG: cell wall metabolism sensor histidine kinase WalK [Chlorobium sp.]
MHTKVSFRLGVAIGMIIFFTVLISYLSLGRQLTELLTTATKSELRRDLLFNKQMLEQQPAGWQSDTTAEAWAQRVGRALELRVTLIDPEGLVIGDSYIPSAKLSLVENHSNRLEVKGAREKGYGEDTRYSQTVHEQMLYMAVSVVKPDGRFILRFAKPLSDTGIFEAVIRKEIEKGVFLALFFSLVSGVLTARFLARPLRKLAETAQKRIHGDFSGSIPVSRSDEIGMLARAFNGMSDEITAMRRREEWYLAVFSGIREAIIVTDAAGDIILVNPAASRTFRIEGAMFKSRPIRQLSDSKLQELFTRVHSNRTALLKEEMSLMTSKGVRIMQVSSMPIMKENRFEGTVFVLNDITKLRNLERVRRDFVSSVSHELRTPLTSIKGYTETLLEGAIHDPEHATAFLQIILQESEQLTALVNDVLDLSRIESGRIEYNFTAVDVSSVVAKSVDLLRQSLDKKQIRLDQHISGNLPQVYADSGYMEIVVRNLLENAIKYVDERNGKIRISAFRSGDYVRLEVEDNGIGIAKQDLGRIFERFYRVDKARSRKYGGTGLGLSIVKHIVLAHKGNVEVRSKVNQGSVFSVIFPVVPEAECSK